MMLVELIRDYQGLFVAVDLLAVLVLLGLAVAAHPKRRWPSVPSDEGLYQIAALGAAALALIVAAVVIPSLTGHRWVGHEGLYLDVFEGRANPEASPALYLTTPLLRLLYRGLGAVPGMPALSMVVLTLLAGALSVWATAGIVRNITRSRAVAVVAACLVALQPVHAFWSSSAYHVMLPFALAQCALLALLVGAERRSTRLLLLSAALGPLSVAGRAETVLFLPAGLALVLLIQGRRLRGTTGIWIPAAALGTLLTGIFLSPMIGPMLSGEGSEWTPALLAALVGQNLLWPHLFTPFDSPAAWPLLVVGLVALVRAGDSGRRAAAGLALLLLAFHLPYCLFSDYAPRHAMAGAASLAAVAGAGLVALWRAGRARWVGIGLGILLLLPTLGSLLEVRERYHAAPEVLHDAVPAEAWARTVDLQSLVDQGCAVITDDPIWDLETSYPHLHVTHPVAGPRLWEDHGGCIVWLYDPSNVVWNSTDVNERAHRVHHLFRWELLGSIHVDYGYPAVVYRMKEYP